MKKFLILLLIIVVLQGSVYLYLDRVVLVPQARFTQQTVRDSGNRNRKPDPPGIYSHDRSYYARLSPTGVKIFSMPDSELCREIKLQENETISYFSWVDDLDLALVGINTNKRSSTTVTLQPVNLETGSKPVQPQISGLPRGSKIADVALSPETNVINILIKSSRRSYVYRTDANNYLRRLHLNAIHIEKIATFKDKVDLLYDSPDNGNVYLLDSRGRVEQISPSGNNYSLVGVDNNNRIYLGKLDQSGLVEQLLVGKGKGTFKPYKTLSYPYPPSSISVDGSGKPQFK